MAKLSFTKLSLKNNNDIKTVNYNDQIIEVKQYLPVNTKLELITNVLNFSNEDNFYNPIKIDIFTKMEMIQFYTNINFTDKQKEDICKTYDLLEQNKIFDLIFSSIPVEEQEILTKGIKETIEAVYQYKNSFMGVLDNVSTNYDKNSVDLEKIRQEIKNASDIGLVKDIVTVLG